MHIKKHTALKKIIQNKTLYLMVLPGMLFLFLFNYLPIGGLVLAFKKYRFDEGILGSKWIGFKNFEFFISSQDIVRITLNTIYMNALFIITGTAASIFIAILINELKSRIAKKLVQSTMLLPNFISWVIAGYFVYALLNADKGLINNLLARVGVETIDWYAAPGYWPPILVLSYLWKNVGYLSIVYLAAIVGINEEYYEVAKIYGANKMQQIFYITIPLITPVISAMTLMSIGRILYADFGLFFNVTRDVGLLYSTTDVIDTYIYRALKNTGDIGMSSAVAFYQSILGFILVMASNLTVKKISPENSLF
jgi:putative aldouronate transport system permease protein